MSMIKLGASGILNTVDGILLGRRSDKDPSLPGYWCTPGGGVEFGESYCDTIVREFKEEAGLDVVVLDEESFLTVTEKIVPGEKHAMMVHRRVIAADPLAFRPSDELIELKFFRREEIFDLLLTPQTRQALERYFI